MRTITMICAVAVAVPGAGASAKAEDKLASCVQRTRFSWKIQFKKKELQRVHRGEKPEEFCKGAPETVLSGQENARLELRDRSGKLLFERKVFLNTTVHFDSVKKDAKPGEGDLTGGVLPAKSTGLSSFLPVYPDDEMAKFRVHLTGEDGRMIAEGVP